jgi:hypothetical protein
VAVRVKLGGGGAGFTVSMTDVFWVPLGSLPVTVNWDTPVGVAELVITLMETVPAPVRDPSINCTMVPVGAPATLS